MSFLSFFARPSYPCIIRTGFCHTGVIDCRQAVTDEFARVQPYLVGMLHERQRDGLTR